MAAIGFGLPKDAFTSLMKQVMNIYQFRLYDHLFHKKLV